MKLKFDITEQLNYQDLKLPKKVPVTIRFKNSQPAGVCEITQVGERIMAEVTTIKKHGIIDTGNLGLAVGGYITQIKDGEVTGFDLKYASIITTGENKNQIP